jgi:hypothetical protein
MVMIAEQLVELMIGKETEVLGEHRSQCRSVHHRSHIIFPGLELGPPQWKAGDSPPDLRRRLGVCYEIPYNAVFKISCRVGRSSQKCDSPHISYLYFIQVPLLFCNFSPAVGKCTSSTRVLPVIYVDVLFTRFMAYLTIASMSSSGKAFLYDV